MNKIHEHFWELIAGKLHGELNETENDQFESNLEIEQNRLYFEKATQIKNGLMATNDLRKSDVKKSWSIINKEIRYKAIRNFAGKFAKYAAIILIAFISGIYIQKYVNVQNQEIQYAEVEVLYGQTSHLFLFDGTEVWLNSGTKFRYPNKFNTDERNVFVDGEAYFKVAKNMNLPFKVNTGNLEVEVFGTSFNVSAYNDQTTQSVVLVEGKVKLNDKKGEKLVDLLPGQIATRTDGSKQVTVKNIDTYSYICWKDGKVIFTDEKLGDIAKKMERWYNVEINFQEESLKSYSFTGTILRNKPIDQTIRAMELLAPISFDYTVNSSKRNIISIVRKR